MVQLLQEPFGALNGVDVVKFTWQTNTGFALSAITYGAIITSIQVPDKNGKIDDVVLGFDDLDSYVEKNVPYFGAAVGRYANRLGGAEFKLDGREFHVTKNVGNNSLHGGKVGFDKVVWTPTVIGTKVIFSYLSKDGEEGYPGDLLTNLSYEVTEDGVLTMEFFSTTSKKTIINLTNHSYLNLAGHGTGSKELFEHYYSINADRITETDSDSIPTGKFLPVGGTDYDFRISKKLSDIVKTKPDLYDDNFCVNTYGNEGLNFVSRAYHPSTGRFLEIHSNQPGVQFYTANFLPNANEKPIIGKNGAEYRRQGAFCFETQNYPDAANHENFPSAVLTPGQVYKHVVKYHFGVEK